MADADTLLKITHETTVLGNTISIKMVQFMNEVKDQPAGFRDLGLDFLSISQILNALEESLTEHFKTKQPFPRQAVPELTKVLSKTSEGFRNLENLLQKFMDYEKGGPFARLQKTWRLVFADKDIAKVRSSLQANKGALNMTMLLTNINPTASTAPVGYEYGILAAKLQDESEILKPAFQCADPAPGPSELPGDTSTLQELVGSPFKDLAIYASSKSDISAPKLTEPKSLRLQEVITSPVSEMLMSETVVAPKSLRMEEIGISSASEMSTSETAQQPSVDSSAAIETAPTPSVEDMPTSIEDLRALAATRTESAARAMAIELQISEQPPAPEGPLRIHVDLSKVPRRVPQQSSGPGNASLQSELLSAIASQKHNVVEQLLDRGVSPDTGPQTIALIQATKNGDLASMKLLLEFGANPNANDKTGNTALRSACQYSRKEGAELLLQYGADPNASCPDLTSLPWAVSTNEEIVRLLLQYGADCNLVMKNGETSLTYVCSRKTLPRKIELMFEYGANPNLKNARGATALQLACSRDLPELVKTLLSHGADPDLPGPELPIASSVRFPQCLELLISAGADLSKRRGILEPAVRYNVMDSVRLLLDAGVDPNEKSQNVHSPLTTAIINNRPDIMAVLLDRGADPNMKGQDMPLVLATRTPELLKKLLERGVDIKKCPGILSNAVSRKSIESVKILLDAGVDPNEKPQGVHAPLMMAIINNNPEIVAYLLSRGADPNLKGINFPLITAVSKPAILKQLIAAGADVNHCNGLLEQAVYHKNIESIDILLEAGVPIDGRPGDLHSPLTTAIRENNLDIISHLLSKGADPNAPGEGFPVTMAARFADTRRLKMILDAGADINWKYKGRTALMEASEWNMVGNVKFLLEKGADANTVDNTGKSAMDLAARKGHNDIVTLLLDVMG